MLYDVIIVGGGPAGAIAGITLHNRNYKVLLIDKATFPRHKPCGGGISRRILRRFPLIAQHLHRIPVHDIQAVSLRSPDGTVVHDEREHSLYLMIRRYDFDALLLNLCKQGGIDVREAATVTHLNYTPDAIEVVAHAGEKMTGKLVIGADGVHSVVARQSGLNPGWQPEQIAIDFMEETPSEHLQIAPANTMHVFYGFGYSAGYGYIFPKHDYLNIGIGFLWSFFQKHLPKNPYAIYTQFLEFLKQNTTLTGQPQRQNFHGFFVPVGGPLRKTYTHRVLLCGDAAGFVNAFSAEGIYYALVSGEYAAKAALQALERNDFSENVLSGYQIDWRREIGEELELAVNIQQELFTKGHWVDGIVKAARRNQSLRRALTDYMIGELPYRDLKRRMLLHLTPFYLKYKFRKLKVSKYFQIERDIM